jgi:NAD(P)-dependent dehydrogenase (short-subunit alcohol dehydrogenase family)
VAKSVLDQFRLDGKVALVTGGVRGLGITFATALAEVGADVVVVGRSVDTAKAAAAQVASATGRRVVGLEADVTRLADVERMAAEAEKALGSVDILVNSAGVNIRGLAQELTESDWDTVVDINLKGTFLCARALGPRMVARKWGRVINMGSILSVIGLPGRAAYASAKGGVINLTRVLGLEWAGTGVTCNALCPGPFATEMNRALLDDPVKYQDFCRQVPMGRFGEINELTGAIVFLASDASSFMTGAPLFVDGGWTAR